MPKPTASASRTSKPSTKAPVAKRLDDIHVGRTNLFTIKWQDAEPALLKPDEPQKKDGSNRFNARQDFADIFEFAESLRGGIRVPLRGYMGANGKFQITDGERRWRGAKILSQKNVSIPLPIIREPQGYTEVDRTLDLLLTNSGKPLDMLEQAHAFARLLEQGLDENEVAKRSGRSQTHITNCLTLLQAAPEVQKAVAAGEMAPTLAVDLVKALPDPARQAEELRAAKQKLADKATPSRNGASKPSKSKSNKITAKTLNVATGKKAAKSRGQKPEGRGQSAPLGQPVLKDTDLAKLPKADDPALKKLEDLYHATSSSEPDKARLETLEFLVDYVKGKESLAKATKFILGMI
jgi:ParB/RepB/Spo0J family partition protein